MIVSYRAVLMCPPTDLLYSCCVRDRRHLERPKLYISVFLKRHFEKKIKNPTQYATGRDHGRIHPEGEDDRTCLGGPQRHLKFGKKLKIRGGGVNRKSSTSRAAAGAQLHLIVVKCILNVFKCLETL